MKAQGSRNGKALGISELLASACSASAPLDTVNRKYFVSNIFHAIIFRVTVFMLMERKQKKIISNLVCAQLESKQFQEVNFLVLIRCCVVIEQLA